MTDVELKRLIAFVGVMVAYYCVVRLLIRWEREDRVLRGLSREWRGEERE